MLTKTFVALGVVFLASYTFLEVVSSSDEGAPTVRLEPVSEPRRTISAGTNAAPTISTEQKKTPSQLVPSVSAGPSIAADTVSAQAEDTSSPIQPEGQVSLVKPTVVPEVQALLADQPAIQLLTRTQSIQDTNIVDGKTANLADLPTNSIESSADIEANTDELAASEEENATKERDEAALGVPDARAEAPQEIAAADSESTQANEGLPSRESVSANQPGPLTMRVMTVDIGMVALRSAPTQNSLISGTAQRGDMLTAVPVEGSNWMLVQDARSGAIGYLPKTVLRELLN